MLVPRNMKNLHPAAKNRQLLDISAFANVRSSPTPGSKNFQLSGAGLTIVSTKPPYLMCIEMNAGAVPDPGLNPKVEYCQFVFSLQSYINVLISFENAPNSVEIESDNSGYSLINCKQSHSINGRSCHNERISEKR